MSVVGVQGGAVQSSAAQGAAASASSLTEDAKKVEVSRISTTSADGTVTTVITYSDGTKETRVKHGDQIILKSNSAAKAA